MAVWEAFNAGSDHVPQARCRALVRSLLSVGALTALGIHGMAYAQSLPAPSAQQQRIQQQIQQQQDRIEQQQHKQEADTQLQQQAKAAQALSPERFARLPKSENPCFTIQQVRFAGVDDKAVPEVLTFGLQGG